MNWLASQIRFSGSWSELTSLASVVALLLHSQEPPSGADADAEIANARLQAGAADDVGDGVVDVVVDLRRVWDGRVALIIQGEEEDIGDERRGGGAACQEERWGFY